MSSKTNNRIDKYVERNSFRLAGSVNKNNQNESRSISKENSLNTFRPSKNKKALKGSREKEPSNQINQ